MHQSAIYAWNCHFKSSSGPAPYRDALCDHTDHMSQRSRRWKRWLMRKQRLESGKVLVESLTQIYPHSLIKFCRIDSDANIGVRSLLFNCQIQTGWASALPPWRSRAHLKNPWAESQGNSPKSIHVTPSQKTSKTRNADCLYESYICFELLLYHSLIIYTRF